MSWQHLTFVSLLMIIMLILSVFWGCKNRHRSDKEKNKVLIVSAILIDGIELFKIVLLCFCAAAYIANILLDYNYMFLMRGDGTPYDILYNWVGGHQVWYPVGVVALFLVYISAFYGGYFLLNQKIKK